LAGADHKPKPGTVVFDIGGVLIDWDPRYLYRQLFAGDDAAMEHFLTHICSTTWNLMQDAGRSFAEAVDELSARYPEHRDMIVAYDQRWEEMVPGTLEESVEILQTLCSNGTPLYAITNFSAEKFALMRRRYEFFDGFIDIVVSGEVRLIKPDRAIYLRLLNDHRLDAADCVFIDDSAFNVHGAQQVGMQAIHFRSPAQLRQALTEMELL
jgi:2-haloacid dehalogenase